MATAAQPARRRPGGRGRIGLIQPAPGVMLEHEWPAFLPSDVLFPVARVPLREATAAGYDDVAAKAPDAARDLARAGADLIAYACTVGSLYAGAEAEQALVHRLADASGKPAISLAESCVRAFHALGVTRLAVLTPYDDRTNAWVTDYAASQGLEVIAIRATPVTIVALGDLQPPEIADLSLRLLNEEPNAEALWLPCTAMQTLKAIPFIEAIGGKPVVSGSQALFWRALGMLGQRPVRDAGRLFGEGNG